MPDTILQYNGNSGQTAFSALWFPIQVQIFPFKGGHNGQRGMEHITNGFKLVEPTTNILFSFFLFYGTNSHCNLGILDTFCYLNI